MLHMIKCDEPVVEHEHRVKQANLVAKALWQTLDQPHHVVAEVTNCAGNKRRQSWQTHRLKTLDSCPQKRNGIFFFPNNPIVTFQDTRAVCVTKNFLGICSGKSVTCDFFAAFNAFQEKRMSRALRDSKIGADRRKKVSRENIVNRNEVALFGKALKLGVGRLNHRTRDLCDVTVYTRTKRAVCESRLPNFLLIAQRGQNGLPHREFRRTRLRPDFPLSKTLRQEHIEAGNRGDFLFMGKL